MPPTNGQDKWPTQDGIDRSESFAIIAILTRTIRPRDMTELAQRLHSLSPEVQPQLEKALNESVQSVLGTDEVPKFEAKYYLVGPMAGGLTSHYIATVWEHRDDITFALSALADTWAVAEIAKQVKQRLAHWIHSVGDPRLDVSVAFTPEVLEMCCLNHVRCNYHPRAQLKSEWQVLTQEFFGGYVSPAHPTGSLEYVVLVKGRGRTYTYHITGTGEVLAHNVREGKKVFSLPTPNLFSDCKAARIQGSTDHRVESHGTH